jgi:hypothetical protein
MAVNGEADISRACFGLAVLEEWLGQQPMLAWSPSPQQGRAR